MNVTPVRHCPACRTAFSVYRAAYGSYRTTFSRPAATKR